MPLSRSLSAKEKKERRDRVRDLCHSGKSPTWTLPKGMKGVWVQVHGLGHSATGGYHLLVREVTLPKATTTTWQVALQEKKEHVGAASRRGKLTSRSLPWIWATPPRLQPGFGVARLW